MESIWIILKNSATICFPYKIMNGKVYYEGKSKQTVGEFFKNSSRNCGLIFVTELPSI